MRIKLLAYMFLTSLFFSSLFTPNKVDAGNDEWTPIGLFGAQIETVAIDPENNNVIYAGTASVGLYKSTNGGNTWENIGIMLPSQECDDFVIDSQNSNNIYVALNQNSLFRSSDGGLTWDNLNTDRTSSVAISPIDNNVLLIGGFYGEIWRSVNNGGTWEETTGFSQSWQKVNDIDFAPNAPHIVYAAGFDGVWKSFDSGQTWSSINNGFAMSPLVYSLAIDPFDSQVVYIGTGDDGLYKTTNGGATWMPIGTGLNSSHIGAIVINPGNQQLLYVGGSVNPGTGIPGVYKSFDNFGLTWTEMMNGMGSRGILDLAIDNSTPRNLYAGTVGGMWKYTLSSEPKDYSVSINEGDLYTNDISVNLNLTAPTGTSEILVSNDGGFTGATWQPFVLEIPWTITSYGETIIPRTIYVKFKTYGQTTGIYQDDIILDMIPPTGSIVIEETNTNIINTNSSIIKKMDSSKNNFTASSIYLPLIAKNMRLGFSLLHLGLSASDDMSGVNEMLISNEINFVDAQWEPYSSTKEWWVPDTLVKTVYVKYRDRAGNISAVYSDSQY